MNKKQILSVAAGMVMLTACSEYDPGLTGGWTGDYTPAELQLMEKYTENFEARYGTIDENHTWGFGSAEAGAKTRGANPKGNMWEEEGWKIPPMITPEQRDIVRQYFQQNPNLTYTDPQWTNFWIQQIYSGGTNTNAAQTEERYTIGDGNKVVGGECMDHLVSRNANGVEDHIYNFNNSDNNAWGGRMLMENSSTYSFGYYNSNESSCHYGKAALVSWTVIRDWANAKGLNGDCLDDKWNRSYMGFDWEQAASIDCYAAIIDWDKVVWSLYPNHLASGLLGYETFEFEGVEYKYLNEQTNKYTADESEPTYRGKKEFQDKPADDTIRELLALGYLPVFHSEEKVWFKIPDTAGSDGYYSDWIVTLTEANKTPNNPDTPDTPSEQTWYRIMCEDLGNTNDFDFNDLVFDVYFTGEPGNYTAHVRVQAAGGTLPIYLACDGNETWEAHHILGVWDETIAPVNVGTGNTAAPKDVEIYNLATNNPNDIDIYVEKVVAENTKETILLPKSGTNRLLTKAPQKICIPNGQNVRWMKEMQQIESAYPHFADWVQNEWGQYGFSGATPWTTTDVNSGPLY
ncbi:MAG: hypothetical protein K2I99_00195 [Bacteroidaceae bacterium]|nr:hypothetical protein [Bacteroidaceae bacterium]